jgi:hypothetical protein
MNKIDTLIAYLFAIQACSKDIHYSVSKEAFYSKHLLADEIYKGIDEQVDALIETCILPYDIPYPMQKYWRDVATFYKPDVFMGFLVLEDLIKSALSFIEKIDHIIYGQEITKGEQSLIDSIAQDLQRKLGLITRQVG